MTRFLERALAGADQGSLNQETDRLFAYHHATKHSYYSVRAAAHFLDWRNQPNPFRVYQGAPHVELPRNPNFPEVGTFATIAALGTRIEGPPGPGNSGDKRSVPRLDALWLSRLLWHSMAISAWKQVPGTRVRYSLRVNPSSGNLHPTETHLAVRGFTGIEDGLYHYRVEAHALEQRGRGDWVSEMTHALELRAEGFAAIPLVVALTSVFWREAWKYRDRAYRYCCHDLGHAMTSLLLAARALGLRGEVVGHFSDLRVARALGLTQSDEAPMAFLIFHAPLGAVMINSRNAPELLPSIPNGLSEEEVPYYLLLGMHRSTILPEPASQVGTGGESETLGPDETAKEPEPPEKEAPLGQVVRRRRSALDFDPHTAAMARTDLEQLLDFATRDWAADWRGNLVTPAGARQARGRDFIELYVYAHRIAGVEPGVYRWNAFAPRLEQLHRGDVRRVAAYLSLEQSLAGNACFAVSMIADLEAAAHLFGNRGYRYAHFEAGAIGQRLYVGAEALGWNATGIGAFYDDDVHRYLGFLAEREGVEESAYAAEQAALVRLSSSGITLSESHEEQLAVAAQAKPQEPYEPPAAAGLPRQVIYHFAIGRAVPDARLAPPEA